MTLRLRAPRDLAAGLVFMAFATAFWLGAQDYEAGSAARMGPGYLPLLLSGILFLFGLVCAARAFVVTGDAIGRIPLKPVAVVAGAVILFAVLLNTAAILTAFGWAVFIRGLGIQFPAGPF